MNWEQDARHGADPARGSRPGQPARPAIRPCQPAAGAREPLRRPRTGRRRPRTGHFSSAHRDDIPAMLSGGAGQPQRWAIVAAATTSMGHRCGCPARLSSIDVPSLRLRPKVVGQVPGGPEAGDLNGGHREPGAEEPGTRSPASGSTARTTQVCSRQVLVLALPSERDTRRLAQVAPSLRRQPGRGQDTVVSGLQAPQKGGLALRLAAG